MQSSFVPVGWKTHKLTWLLSDKVHTVSRVYRIPGFSSVKTLSLTPQQLAYKFRNGSTAVRNITVSITTTCCIHSAFHLTWQKKLKKFSKSAEIAKTIFQGSGKNLISINIGFLLGNPEHCISLFWSSQDLILHCKYQLVGVPSLQKRTVYRISTKDNVHALKCILSTPCLPL